MLEEIHLKEFLQRSNLKYISSHQLLPRWFECVNDMDDLQILQDAIACNADILLTNNIKDFNVDKIFASYKITVKKQYTELL
jgi:predicted nucleic acid-binding protein